MNERTKETNMNDAIRTAFRIGQNSERALRYARLFSSFPDANLSRRFATKAAAGARYLSTLPTREIVEAAARMRADAAEDDGRGGLYGYENAWPLALPVLNREIWRRHMHGAEVL